MQISIDADIYLEDVWEKIDDDEFTREAARRNVLVLNLDREYLLSLARRNRNEALLEIERELGHQFDGLLTEVTP